MSIEELSALNAELAVKQQQLLSVPRKKRRELQAEVDAMDTIIAQKREGLSFDSIMEEDDENASAGDDLVDQDQEEDANEDATVPHILDERGKLMKSLAGYEESRLAIVANVEVSPLVKLSQFNTRV